MKNKILAWFGAIFLLALCLMVVAYLDDHFELRTKLVAALVIGSFALAKAFFDWIRKSGWLADAAFQKQSQLQAEASLQPYTTEKHPSEFMEEVQARLPNDPPQW